MIALGAVVVIALVLTVLLVDESDRARWGESSRSTVGVLAALVTAWLGGELVYRLRVAVDDDAGLDASNSLTRGRRRQRQAARPPGLDSLNETISEPDIVGGLARH